MITCVTMEQNNAYIFKNNKQIQSLIFKEKIISFMNERINEFRNFMNFWHSYKNNTFNDVLKKTMSDIIHILSEVFIDKHITYNSVKKVLLDFELIDINYNFDYDNLRIMFLLTDCESDMLSNYIRFKDAIHSRVFKIFIKSQPICEEYTGDSDKLIWKLKLDNDNKELVFETKTQIMETFPNAQIIFDEINRRFSGFAPIYAV